MIALIPAGNPGPFTGPTGNNTWLIDGAEPLLVDAGIGEQSHIDALKRALGGRLLARVFLTHAHRDHAAGVPRLREEWPAVEVVDGSQALESGIATIPAGDSEAQIIATPGHSPDHACLWIPESRSLFAGDLLRSGGTILIAGSSGGNLRDYLASLARVRALQPSRIYPGHGPIIDDGGALIDQYVVHRHEREQQVLAVLDRGPATIAQLVAAIYPGLDPALEGAAGETMLAHLHKLWEEGLAAHNGDHWSGVFS